MRRHPTASPAEALCRGETRPPREPDCQGRSAVDGTDGGGGGVSPSEVRDVWFGNHGEQCHQRGVSRRLADRLGRSGVFSTARDNAVEAGAREKQRREAGLPGRRGSRPGGAWRRTHPRKRGRHPDTRFARRGAPAWTGARGGTADVRPLPPSGRPAGCGGWSGPPPACPRAFRRRSCRSRHSRSFGHPRPGLRRHDPRSDGHFRPPRPASAARRHQTPTTLKGLS